MQIENIFAEDQSKIQLELTWKLSSSWIAFMVMEFLWKLLGRKFINELSQQWILHVLTFIQARCTYLRNSDRIVYGDNHHFLIRFEAWITGENTMSGTIRDHGRGIHRSWANYYHFYIYKHRLMLLSILVREESTIVSSQLRDL